MKITINFGSRMTVESIGDSQKDAMSNLGIFADAEAKCGNCGSDAIVPKVRKTEKGQYFELKCCECGHVMQLHQNRDLINMYHKNEWKPPYQGSGERHESSAPPANDPFFADDDGDDIPF